MKQRRRDFLVAPVAVGLSAPAWAGEQSLPAADVAAIIQRHGKPDADVSTAYEKPRPPLVTRRLEYRKAGFGWVLLADAPMNSPPPYARWKLMGLIDLKTSRRISLEEADSRIAQLKAGKR